MTEADGVERFDFKQSYSRIYKPTSKYTPQGIFMSFEHYNVEVRDRVKCISGIEGMESFTFKQLGNFFFKILFLFSNAIQYKCKISVRNWSMNI